VILLFTDYGVADLYIGQVKAVLKRHAPQSPIVDLLHAVASFNILAGAHLLNALKDQFPMGSVFFAVVDPGVGGKREAAVMLADGRWYVGPDNGLLSVVAARATQSKVWHITWRPEHLSHTFHGRDLFAPIAGMVASGHFPEDKLKAVDDLAISFGEEDLAQLIYIDHYGNAMTGLRAARIPHTSTLKVANHVLRYVHTFAEGEHNAAFWHRNSIGLLEIACNSSSAAQLLNLEVGQAVELNRT
jgi:S-adenosylmethionine hydrolase